MVCWFCAYLFHHTHCASLHCDNVWTASACMNTSITVELIYSISVHAITVFAKTKYFMTIHGKIFTLSCSVVTRPQNWTSSQISYTDSHVPLFPFFDFFSINSPVLTCESLKCVPRIKSSSKYSSPCLTKVGFFQSEMKCADQIQICMFMLGKKHAITSLVTSWELFLSNELKKFWETSSWEIE